MTQPLTAMDTAIIDRWLARQEGMPPGDVIGATIVRSLREQMESLTARAVRAEEAEASLRELADWLRRCPEHSEDYDDLLRYAELLVPREPGLLGWYDEKGEALRARIAAATL